MNVNQLDELFKIAEYQPNKAGQAIITLVDGTIKLRIPYYFRTADGSVTPEVLVTGEATAQQLQDLKQFLITILQATNVSIESEHGWTKYYD